MVPNRRQTINVTEKHIKEATRADSSHCMYADAIRDSIPGATYVAVDLQTMRFTADGWRYIVLTPRHVQERLLQFDAGIEEAITPYQFRLPDPAQKYQSGRNRKGGSQKAQLARPSGPGSVPTKTGGVAPPVGPLAGGSVPPNVSTGRRRAFGLRRMGRAMVDDAMTSTRLA